MSETGKIVRGPWQRVAPACVPADGERGALEDAAATAREASRVDAQALGGNKIMLGFIVRECAVALGHQPSPEELAAWANHQCDARGEFCLFGRPITVAQARVILRHLGRSVTVRPERMRPRCSAAEPGSF